MTAPFPETPLGEVAQWTADNGFTTIEIACWPASSGDTRRYAGTSHIDVDGLSGDQASEIVADMDAHGLEISGLGYYPNPLHPDDEHARMVIDHLKKVIAAAGKMGVAVVNTFIGADRVLTQDENWEKATRVWPEI
ncbi:MAG TPA: TIM barrel protein, partial [Acidimicrobiia bacterium]